MINASINGQFQIFKNNKLEYKFNNYILKSNFYDSNNNLTLDSIQKIRTLNLTTSIDVDLSANYNISEFPIIKSIYIKNNNNAYLAKLNIPTYKKSEDDNNYYYEFNYLFRYDDVENLGNFTAISVNSFAATYVKDANGNKATFSKLENEILDIVYSIKLKLSKSMSMTFNGITYNNLKLKDLSIINQSFNNISTFNPIFELLEYGSQTKMTSDRVTNLYVNYPVKIDLFYDKFFIKTLDLDGIIYNNNYNDSLSISTNNNNIKFNIKNQFTRYYTDVPIINSYDIYGKYYRNSDTSKTIFESKPTFKLLSFPITLGNIYFGKRRSELNKYITNIYDNTADQYIYKTSTYYLKEGNINKILFIDRNNDTEYNDYINYDNYYHIILDDIERIKKKWPTILEKIGINSDISKEVTFDDAYNFIKNIRNFLDELKNFLKEDYNELFYRFKIEIPQESRLVVPENTEILKSNFNYILNIQFSFNEGY